jgi:hypothetical protein
LIGQFFVGEDGIPILAVLPDISMHSVKAERIGETRADLLWLLRVLIISGVFVEVSQIISE